MQNPAALARRFNLKCALACAKGGIPDSMPDLSQREKLVPFVGKYVRVTGTVYEQGGTRAVAMTSIRELKNLHLITDAR